MLEKVTALEKKLTVDPKELEVCKIFADRAKSAGEKLKTGVEPSYNADKAALVAKVEELKAAPTPDGAAIQAAEKAVGGFPKDTKSLRGAAEGPTGRGRESSPPLPHGTPFVGTGKTDEDKQKSSENKRNNLLALAFSLMVGTAALPHILMRYYTTHRFTKHAFRCSGRCTLSSCCTSRCLRWRCW